MKIDVVHRGGRKKDFWDIHEINESYSIAQMLRFCEQRHPYTYNEEIMQQLVNFEMADNDFEPNCLKGKYWELIKYDILTAVRNEQKR